MKKITEFSLHNYFNSGPVTSTTRADPVDVPERAGSAAGLAASMFAAAVAAAMAAGIT